MNVTTQPLRELAREIFVGIPAPRGNSEAGEGVAQRIINVRDLVDGRVLPGEELETVCFSARSAVERYRVCAGDVLLTSRGTQLKVALVGADAAGAVATSNLLVIRPDVQFPGALIYAFFCSPSTQAMLLCASRSSGGLLALTARDVGEVRIPVPPAERLERLAQLVEATEVYYAAAVTAARTAREAAQGVVMAELSGSARKERA